MGPALAALTSTVYLTGCFRNYSAKNHNTQIRVSGFRKIVENATYSLYVDESTRTAQIEAHRTGITITSGQSFSNYGDFVIPTKYYPKRIVIP